jgi:two-component system, LytTR family, response regulator LytT
MRILILEDEEQAANRLKKIVGELMPGALVCGILPTLEKAINWFADNQMPDLIFLDIQLADGNSFQIFKMVKITCPVIFTTAHESYALQAFKVNSVDYLLKPIDKEDVKAAVEKLKLLQSKQPAPVVNYQEVIKTMQPPASFRERFIIKMGDTIKSINTADVAYFFTENKSNFILTNDGRRFPIDFNLDQVEQMLNPKIFFRINRQFIIGHHSIEEMKAHTRSRVIVKLRPTSKLDTIVAIDRAHDFRTWLAGE